MTDCPFSNSLIHRRESKPGTWRVSRATLPEESEKLSTVQKMQLVLLNGAKLFEALPSFPSTTSIIPIVLTLQLLSYPEGTRGLRMTALQIPQHVVINQTVKMECNFNLDRELLYSVKWYKDGHEFYRFVPRDSPAVQVFPVPGVSVDINHSTERSIALNSVDLTSTGRYRCEVSAEAPAFQTVSDHADMSVVVLPEKGPRITGGRAKYQEGDLVRMNCTSAPSKPAALLTWFINGEPADSQYLRGPHIIAVDERGLETAVLGLEFHVSGKHFSNGGDMKLKCLATIATMYQHGKEESVEGDDRVIKAPVMESRETRAQSHTRNDLTNDSSMEPMTLGSPVGSPVQTPGSPGSNAAYLPSFLLGESNMPARLGMTSPPDSPRYVNAPGGNLTSPLSNYGTPDYRHNRQKAMFGNATSPNGGQMSTEGHTGGPPTRGLFDALEITQSPGYGTPNNRASVNNPHNQSSRLLTNTTNNSIFLDNVANLTSNESPSSQGLLQWVTVFGFPPNAINTVLSHISNRVRIVDKHPAPHPQSNWIHLKCATDQEAQRALACNGNVVSGAIMIGVTPCMDEGVIFTPDKENRGNFNSSMRIFTSPGKSSQSTSGGGVVGESVGSSLRSPIKIQNARPLASGYNQHTSPQAVRAAENVPQRSTGFVSKAMEYVFGW